MGRKTSFETNKNSVTSWFLIAQRYLHRFGRKKPAFLYFIIGGITCITASVLPKNDGKKWQLASFIRENILQQSCISESLDAVKTFLSLFGRTCLGGDFAIMFIYTSELFPTVIRYENWWIFVQLTHEIWFNCQLSVIEGTRLACCCKENIQSIVMNCFALLLWCISNDVALTSQWCCLDVTMMLYWWCNNLTGMLWWSYDVIVTSQWCHVDVTMILHRYFSLS